MLANHFTSKRSYSTIKMFLFQGCWSSLMCKFINLMHYINRRRKKNHMIISKDAEKCYKNSASFHDKGSEEGMYFKIIKVIYDKSITNIPNILN
jgi:hypothetical protein